MLTIPLQAVPAQLCKIVLGGQNCRIRLYQKTEGLFIDINADGIDIVTCVIARNAALIVCRGYSGFVGNFMFIDTQGNTDPAFAGLKTRYSLIYLTEAETNVIV